MSGQSFDEIIKGIDFTKMYEEPDTTKSSFTCPHCFSKAPQKWYKIGYFTSPEEGGFYKGVPVGPPALEVRGPYYLRKIFDSEMHFSVCIACSNITIWIGTKIVYPQILIAPLPHRDMPPNVREVYEEARQVFPYSIRAACALLRLSLECLMDHLNVLSPDDLLGKRLKHLIDSGQLPSKVLKAMESVRVYGNDMIHNVREIRTDDDQKTALQLFRLVNFIIEKTITEEKMIQEIYDPIPQQKKRVPDNDPQESN